MFRSRHFKPLLGMLMAAALFLSACGPSTPHPNESGKLNIYTSIDVLADFTAKIGGDYVKVTTLVPAGSEPHDWEPTAQDILRLEKADMLVYNGAGLEHWVSDVLSSLENKELIAVDTSQGLTLLEGHSHDDEQDLEVSDPHIWLNPINAKEQMAHIRDALVQADPDHAPVFTQNYNTYAALLDALDTDIRNGLSALPNKTIIVAHEAFGYFCQAYGLTQLGISGLSPEQEPTAARLAELIEFSKQHHITTIFFESTVDPKVAQSLANAVGAKTALFSPLEGYTAQQKADGADYFSLMRQNLAALITALQ